MKKIFFSVFFLSLMIAGAQAQSAAKACCAKGKTAAGVSCESKAASVSVAVTDEHNMAAAKLASSDPSIESRTNSADGTVSYVRKASLDNGAYRYDDVTYDASTNTFVNVSPEGMAAPKKACCAAKAGAAAGSCSGDKVKAVKASAPVN